MFNYCTVLLNPETKSDIIAACIQAEATITAAHEQANASVSAGRWAASAGVLAVIGGVWAYVAAVRQSRFLEQEALNKNRMYRIFLCDSIINAALEINSVLKLYETNPGLLISYFDTRAILPVSSSVVEILSPSNWSSLINAGSISLDAQETVNLLKIIISDWHSIIEWDKNNDSSIQAPLHIRLHKGAISSLTEDTFQQLNELGAIVEKAPLGRSNSISQIALYLYQCIFLSRRSYN